MIDIVSNEKKISEQKLYCKSKKYPCFAPDDGICFYCGRQIYNKISLLKASTELITGCPYCHHTYCD